MRPSQLAREAFHVAALPALELPRGESFSPVQAPTLLLLFYGHALRAAPEHPSSGTQTAVPLVQEHHKEHSPASQETPPIATRRVVHNLCSCSYRMSPARHATRRKFQVACKSPQGCWGAGAGSGAGSAGAGSGAGSAGAGSAGAGSAGAGSGAGVGSTGSV